ncbi:hypothetical protein PIB30_031029 [Stylosanthes scabra]|nr:hypothetical protein [Stylosanthes scabra]
MENTANDSSQPGALQQHTKRRSHPAASDKNNIEGTEDPSGDLVKEPLKSECKARNLKGFGNYAYSRVNDIEPKVHRLLLMGCCGFLVYLVMLYSGGNSPAKLEQISASVAILEFLHDIVWTSLFLLIYLLAWLFLWPLHFEAKVFVGLLLTASPIFYVDALAGKASGVSVLFGFFSLPLICLVLSASLALAFLCGSIIVFTSYSSWKRGKEKDIMLDYAISLQKITTVDD